MRARIKETGNIVEVIKSNNIWYDKLNDEYYFLSDLDFNCSDMPSEQLMRYELLKISIQGILSSDRFMDGIYNTSKESNIDVESIIVKTARGLTDETIKQFKENY